MPVACAKGESRMTEWILLIIFVLFVVGITWGMEVTHYPSDKEDKEKAE